MKQSNTLTIGTGSATGTGTFSRCYPGDILVTASDTTNSAVIQVGTCSKFSHAVLMLDHERAIEAVPDGVNRALLNDVLNQSSEVFVLRHKQIVFAQALKIAGYATSQLGKPYDFLGAARAGTNSGCSGAFKYGAPGMTVLVADSLAKFGGDHDTSFFCSELIAKAYLSVGLSLSSK